MHHDPVEPDVDVPTLPAVVREGSALAVRLVRSRPLPFAIAVLGAGLFVTAIVASARVAGWLTDEVIRPIVEDGVEAGEQVPLAVAVLLGVGMWKVASITLRRVAATRAEVGARIDLRKELVDHQLQRPFGWFASQRVGDLLAVNETFTRNSTGALGPLPFATGGVLLLVGATVAVWLIDPVLAAMVAVAMVIVVGADLTTAWLTFAAFEREIAVKTVVSRIGHESVDGAQTVRALGAEQAEVDRFATSVASRVDAEVAVARTFSWMRSFIEALPPTLSIPIVVVGALRVGDTGAGGAGLSVGDVVTVGYLMSLLAWPLALIAFVVWDLAHSVSAWRQVSEVLDATDVEATGSSVLDGAGPLRVGVERLSFAHPLASGPVTVQAGPSRPVVAASARARSPRVLDDVTFDVEPGSTVVLVGPTGSGKSTLASLLARLRQPDDGVVLLDGVPAGELDVAALRRAVAHVGQEAFVFGETLRFNVDLDRGLSHAALVRAARMAALDGVVAELPDGWSTVLGERGTTLSGGQRQRVALARALAGRPRLLLLDDATSAVDPTVEARILAALRTTGTTVVMVASRPSSVALADRVVFLVDGRVAAVGTHEELVHDVAAYAALLRSFERDATDRARELVDQGPGR